MNLNKLCNSLSTSFVQFLCTLRGRHLRLQMMKDSRTEMEETLKCPPSLTNLTSSKGLLSLVQLLITKKKLNDNSNDYLKGLGTEQHLSLPWQALDKNRLRLIDKEGSLNLFPKLLFYVICGLIIKSPFLGLQNVKCFDFWKCHDPFYLSNFQRNIQVSLQAQ